MDARQRIHRARRAALAAGSVVALAAAMTVATASASQAAAQGPCDIYAAGGTPCVAAHSTTRALYAGYDGPLYQVRRASDNTTADIGLLSAGGYADAAAQDAFCANTTCVITVIYDQSGEGNNLTDAPAGGAAGGPDNLANATAAPTLIDGHKAYGVYVAAGTGYRDNTTTGIATGDQSEGEYAVLDGTHFNGGCCFDYGNAETDSHDDGNGTMEAIYFGNIKVWGYGSGTGPWIMADMENGLYSGVNAGLNAGDPSIEDRYTTAMIEGGQNQWAILGGNAQSGDLSTFYSGPRPNVAGYNPMRKQGAIILGIGGDNSKGSAGTFYEGVMTSGYPSAATEDAVQANITAADYQAIPIPLAAGPRISLQATADGSTSDYVKHDDSDDGVVSVPLTASSSQTDKADATWVETAGLANPNCVSFESVNQPGNYLRHQNFVLHLQSDDGSALFSQDATFCPEPGNSGQGISFQSVNYPTKYLRAYAGGVDLASDGGTNPWDSATTWAADSSWLTAAPLEAPVIASVSVASGATVSGTDTVTVDIGGAAKDVSYTYIELNRAGTWLTDNTKAPGSHEDGLAPNLVLDTTAYPNGDYQLKIDAVAPDGSTNERIVPIVIDNPPAWNAATVYDDGDQATYQGSIWQAIWWTRNQAPGGTAGAWEQIATAADGGVLWTPSRVFTGGETAEYQGVTYQARYWSRDAVPTDSGAYGPWKAVS